MPIPTILDGAMLGSGEAICPLSRYAEAEYLVLLPSILSTRADLMTQGLAPIC